MEERAVMTQRQDLAEAEAVVRVARMVQERLAATTRVVVPVPVVVRAVEEVQAVMLVVVQLAPMEEQVHQQVEVQGVLVPLLVIRARQALRGAAEAEAEVVALAMEVPVALAAMALNGTQLMALEAEAAVEAKRLGPIRVAQGV
jgi:hypothetical protein